MDMQKYATTVTNMVNSFSFDYKGFCTAMQREHRTLQQSFTRLCLTWIKFCASPEYPFDGRNEASHEMCKNLLQAAEKGGMDTSHLDLPMV